MYSEGQLTKFYSDIWFEVLTPNNRKNVPIDNTTSKFAGIQYANHEHTQLQFIQILDRIHSTS